MKTNARVKDSPKMFSRNAVLLAGLLLAIRLAAASVLAAAAMPAAQAPASPAVPLSTGPKAYVALYDDNEVAVVNTRTNTVTAYIPGVLQPRNLIASPDGRAIYVGSDGLPTVSVIDTSTDEIVASIRVGFDQRGMSLSPDGRELLVSLWSADEVVGIDTVTNQVTWHATVSRPERSAISPDGRRAYVISTDNGAPALAVLDLLTHSRIAQVRLDASPVALTFASDGNRLYLTMADMRSVLALEPVQNRITARIVVPAGPRNTAPAQDARSMLVVSRADGALDFVDLVRGVVSETIVVGKRPAWVAVGLDGHSAYVTNENSDDVSVIDLDRGTVVATFSVGHAAREIVLQPEARQRHP
jgi:YVTN family beta-propeller protein